MKRAICTTQTGLVACLLAVSLCGGCRWLDAVRKPSRDARPVSVEERSPVLPPDQSTEHRDHSIFTDTTTTTHLEA